MTSDRARLMTSPEMLRRVISPPRLLPADETRLAALAAGQLIGNPSDVDHLVELGDYAIADGVAEGGGDQALYERALDTLRVMACGRLDRGPVAVSGAKAFHIPKAADQVLDRVEAGQVVQRGIEFGRHASTLSRDSASGQAWKSVLLVAIGLLAVVAERVLG